LIVILAPASVAFQGGDVADNQVFGMDAEADTTQEYVVGFWQLPDERDSYQGEPVVDVDADLDFFVVETDNPVRFERQAKQDDRVRYVEENHDEYDLAYTPNDPRLSDQYGPQQTNTESAWDTTLGSTSVVLGYLDSGITADHEDFVNSRVSGYDYVNGDGTPEDHNGCNYHGSHTAGTGAATTDNGQGIAGMSESSIDMHKIFDSGFFGCGSASTSDIAQALKDHGNEGNHISSNSWGGGSDQALLDAIDYANDKGVIHVAAAGNDGECTDCVSDPWKSRPSKVVIVSCTENGETWCSFSSQGPEVDLAAPGNSILSVDGGDTTGYQNLDGTSMSTPHVSGAVALYIAANGDVSHSKMESLLADSAEDVGLSLNRQGAGELDTGALVGSSSGNSAPTADFTYSCTDLTCDFDGSSSSDSDGSISSYDWDFGDGNTGTGETVTHTYASGGTYTVTLTVTDDDGATDSQSQDVSVSDSTAGGIHVGDLDGSSSGGQGGTWTATVNVLVHDANHTAEDGSTVTLDYQGDKGASGTLQCTTGSDGTCSVSETFRNRESPVDFTVTDISDSDGTYDSSSNHDPDGDSDGTTITVAK
jgi:serine protease